MLGVVVALLGGVTLLLLLCLLIFLAVTWYKASKAETPPGVSNPALLRRLHTLYTGAFILGDTLEYLGLWTTIRIFHFLSDMSERQDDAELLTKDAVFSGVTVRVYRPRSPSTGGTKGIIFFHGGGFVFDSINSYDRFCRHLTKHSGAVVVSVGYRLAPDHRCPTAFDDCLSATIHFLKTAEEHGVDPSSVIICGDSAGGNLTAGVCQALVGRSDLPKPLAQVMIYPMVQMADFNLPSYQQNKRIPFLSVEQILQFLLIYLGSDLSLSDGMVTGSHVPPQIRQKLSRWLDCEEFRAKGYKPHIMAPFNKDVYQKVKQALHPPCSLLFSDDAVIRQLPQAYILTCEYDVLRDEGILYRKRLEDNGVPVTWFHVKDGFHGIVGFFDHPEVVSGKLAMENVITYIKNL